MANRYWVGGSGSWVIGSTTNWSATSGGPGGASVPTAADSVFFDQAGTYTVGVYATVTCLDITVSAGTVTFGQTGTLAVSGSMSIISGTVWNAGTISFNANTAGKTITTNGVALAGVTFNGGVSVTLGSSLTCSALTITSGGLNTSAVGNYAITCLTISATSTSISSLTLNASTVTVQFPTAITMTGSGFTLNAGTSQINLTGTTGVTFSSKGLTFYNVAFTDTGSGYSHTISGINTFNNLSFPAVAADGSLQVIFSANQTINGDLTGSGTSATRRLFYRSNTLATARTLTLARPATLINCDFRDITAATNAITATGGGNCGGNINITGFPAAKTVYWNLNEATSWNATGWATTSGGTPAVANFPLAQDTAVIDNAGAATIINFAIAGMNVGTINMSARTTAMTLNTSNPPPNVYGSWLNGTGVTLAGTVAIPFIGRAGTQQISGNGVAFTQGITVQKFTSGGPILQLTSAVTLASTATFTLTTGTLDLQSYTLTTGLFSSSSSSNVRAIAFGTGSITVNGTGTVWNMNLADTAVTVTGTPVVNVSNNSATAATVSSGTLTESNSISFNFTTGTYALTLTTGTKRNLNFTGFAGTVSNTTQTIYGDLNLGSTATFTAGTNTWTFASTSTGKTITSNGKTMNFPVTFNGTGGSWALQDAMTIATGRTCTLTAGTIDLNDKTLSLGAFTTSGTIARTIAFGTGNISLGGNFTYNTGSNLTTTGSKVVNANGTMTMFGTSFNEANALDFNFTGTGNFSYSDAKFRNLDLSGFSGTFTFGINTLTIYGSLNVGSTVQLQTGGTSTCTFASTSTGKTITSSGRTLDCPITFSGVGGSWILQDNMTLGSSRTTTLTAGTLNLNSFTLTTGFFSSSGSGSRTIAFGSTGSIILSGTTVGTKWNTGTVTNLSITGEAYVQSTGAGSVTKTFNTGTLSEANSISFSIADTVGTIAFTANNTIKNLTVGNNSITISNIPIIIYGSCSFAGTNPTLSSGTNPWTFASTSGIKYIATNGETLDFPLTFNGVGGTWQLLTALTMGSTRSLTHTNGTLDLSGKTLTVGTQYTTSPGTKNLTFNGGTLICPGSGFAFSVGAAGFTTTAGTGTGTISLTSASAKSFSGGGGTFNCTLNQGGAGDLTIAEGGNTFNNITNTVQPASVLFPAGTTTTFNNFNLNGTAGNLITIGSVTAAQHTLFKSTGTVNVTYCSISYSNATGGAIWNADATNVNGGNNTGWFSTESLTAGNFFMLFN